MNVLRINKIGSADNERQGGRSRLRIMVPGLVFFLAGTALSAIWFSTGGSRNATSDLPAVAQLSDATKLVLEHLDSPVEIRFYSRLDPSSVQETVQAFAGRVDQLLSQYEHAAGNRVTVTRYNSTTNFVVNAAAADGIKAFNIDKGDSCFLGIAVVCGRQKVSLPNLAPEWEQALEPDLTRAIARAAEAKAVEQPVASVDTAALDAVKKMIPNLDAISVEEGTQVLRDAALAQFAQTGLEMQTKVKEAEDRFLQAQGSQCEAAQESAAGDLRKIQAEEAEKLKQIALISHAQIAALEQLKRASP